MFFRRKKMTEAEKNPAEVEILEPNTNLEEGLDTENAEGDLDPAMFAQVQEMMSKMQRADELEQEVLELKGRLGRLMSDFEGYRTRTQQDLSAAETKGIAKAVETLCPVLDDLSRAIEFGQKNPEGILAGLDTVQSNMLRLFGKLGLEQTGHKGETFDPNFHEALQVIEGEEDDVIMDVFQVGFRIGDKLVRPSRVVVSRKSN
jgi:molecular chaperone GrpE